MIIHNMADSSESFTPTPEIHRMQKITFLGDNLIKPKSQFDFVPGDTEECEFVDVVGFGDVASRCSIFRETWGVALYAIMFMR